MLKWFHPAPNLFDAITYLTLNLRRGPSSQRNRNKHKLKKQLLRLEILSFSSVYHLIILFDALKVIHNLVATGFQTYFPSNLLESKELKIYKTPTDTHKHAT